MLATIALSSALVLSPPALAPSLSVPHFARSRSLRMSDVPPQWQASSIKSGVEERAAQALRAELNGEPLKLEELAALATDLEKALKAKTAEAARYSTELLHTRAALKDMEMDYALESRALKKEQATNADLEARMAALITERDDLQVRVRKAEDKAAELQVQLLKAEARLTTTKVRSSDLEESLDKESRKSERLGSEVESLGAECASLGAAVEAAETFQGQSLPALVSFAVRRDFEPIRAAVMPRLAAACAAVRGACVAAIEACTGVAVAAFQQLCAGAAWAQVRAAAAQRQLATALRSCASKARALIEPPADPKRDDADQWKGVVAPVGATDRECLEECGDVALA